MFQGLPQGATQIAQGAALYIFNRKDFNIIPATVANVSQPHVSKAAQANPSLAMQGFVVDLTLSMGNETTTIEFPVNSSSANYADKAWFVSPDRALVTREIEAMESASKQHLAQNPWHEKVVSEAPNLIIQLNPERQNEAKQAEEIAMLKKQLEEMRRSSSETGAKLDKVLAFLAVDSPRNSRKKEE